MMDSKPWGRMLSAVCLAAVLWAPAALAQRSGRIHIVRQGDTLYSVARANDTTVEALRCLNGLDDARIRIGQSLWIELPDPALANRTPAPHG